MQSTNLGAPATPALAVAQEMQELGPRAKAFVEKATTAKTKIVQKVLTILVEDQALSPSSFIAKNVTAVGQASIASLDKRVNILFTNIVFQSFGEISKIKSAFMGMLMISMHVGDPKAHVKFIKEAGLPIVNELVEDLDKNYPGVIDEAVSGGIETPELIKQFNFD